MLIRRHSLAALAWLIVLAACDGGTDDPLPLTGVATSSATVRFVNATSGGASFDLLSGGTLTTNGRALAYQGASSCLSVPAATPNLTLELTGTTDSLAGFAPTFQAGGRYTILAVGTQANSPQFITLTDSYTTPASGRVRLRIVNATTALQGASLDVYVGTDSTLGTPVATTLAAGSATAFFDLPNGTTRVRLTSAGTQTVVLDTGTLSLASGAVQSIVVTDPAAGGSALRSFVATSC